MSGYQVDLDSNNGFTGQLYEGQGRGIVTSPGSVVQLLPGRVSAKIGTVADNPVSLLKPHEGVEGEWNQIQIITRGNTLVHMINGKVISVTIDDNPDVRAFQGILSLQLEGNGQISISKRSRMPASTAGSSCDRPRAVRRNRLSFSHPATPPAI